MKHQLRMLLKVDQCMIHFLFRRYVQIGIQYHSKEPSKI
ncbi:hypothetical protein KP509_1Z310000 [Ceratopteris richardii]|nr:hypothetical protein KP509_1Z310000 [Ceratopteris richardii]